MVPFGALVFGGVTPIDTNVAGVTVSVAEPETPPSVAPMVVEPWPVELARPFEPAALLMVATAALEELQVTCEVRFWVVPSL